MGNICQANSRTHHNKQSRFHSTHAATRRDDERTFGILQSQFAIGHGPTRFWGKQILVNGEYHDGLCDITQFEHQA
jgi:hypothetical protein